MYSIIKNYILNFIQVVMHGKCKILTIKEKKKLHISNKMSLLPEKKLNLLIIVGENTSSWP
jgi:hypothetical protein